MKPYVGQTVHFVDMADRHLAAIVVWIWENTSGHVVNLAVFDPGLTYPIETSTLTHQSVPYDEGEGKGTWHAIEAPGE